MAQSRVDIGRFKGGYAPKSTFGTRSLKYNPPQATDTYFTSFSTVIV